MCGIHADAYAAGFTSPDELLNRPILEDVDYVPFEWKESMLDKEIFPMSYATFARIFRRVLLVAGFQTNTRVYAFRVGAGADFDGMTSRMIPSEMQRILTKPP